MTDGLGRNARRHEIKDISQNIANKDEFFIDEAVRDLFKEREGAVLHRRWQHDPRGAMAFGRRTLEIAAHEAASAAAVDTGSDIKAWAQAAQLAFAAQNAIDSFIEHALGAFDEPISADENPVLVRKRLAQPLAVVRRIAATRKGQKVSIPQTSEHGRMDAWILGEASALLQWVADEYREKRGAIASRHQNEGNPQKLIFVRRMMEGWIFLTGSIPSSGNRHFAEFVRAGWADVNNEEPDWIHSIRRVRAEFEPNEVAHIAEHGPFWNRSDGEIYSPPIS
jgi:hypothetical protein